MSKKIKQFIRSPLNISNILTVILIIVTIFSVIATVKITNVSLDLDKQRQKEGIISKINYIDKLIIELNENKIKLIGYNYTLEQQRNNNQISQDIISITRTENAAEIIDDKSILQRLEHCLANLKLIKQDIYAIEESTFDYSAKNGNIDVAQQNIGIGLAGIPPLIQKLEEYQTKLEKDLINLDDK